MSVWDHTQNPAEDTPYQTFPTNGVWRGDFPDELLEVMHDDAQTAIQSGNVQRAVAIVLDMAGEQIERAEQ